MAYNEELEERVGKVMDGLPGLAEKTMFGGVGYLLRGNMVCGVLNDDLIVRVGWESYLDLLNKPGTRKFDTTGREMTGWIMVSPDGTNGETSLLPWVRRGLAFAGTLPPKK